MSKNVEIKPEMTIASILNASDVKYKTMKPQFITLVEVASGKVSQYAFLDQIGFDFVVRRVNGRVELLDNDSIVSISADLKKDFDR